MSEITHRDTIPDSKSPKVDLDKALALASVDQRVLFLKVVGKRRPIMPSVRLGPEREFLSLVLGEFGVCKEDLEELIDSSSSRARVPPRPSLGDRRKARPTTS